MDIVNNQIDLRIFNEQWGLLRSRSLNGSDMQPFESHHSFWFFLWIGDDDIPIPILSACQMLSKNPPRWNGVELKFQSEPSPGFTLTIAKDWTPSSDVQEEELFKKMIWEIERLKGQE